MYVRTDLNYPCECAICTEPMTRRVETQEFIDNMLPASFELCTAYSYDGLLFLGLLSHVSLSLFRRPIIQFYPGLTGYILVASPPLPSLSNLIPILTYPYLSRNVPFHSDIQIHLCRRLIPSRSVITPWMVSD